MDCLITLLKQKVYLYNLLNGFDTVRPKLINKQYSIYGVGKLY